MRRTTIAMLVGTAMAVSACGSSAPGATTPRPPAPVNLTVFIDDRSVSVSPSAVGAGPVQFIITNQASQAESLSVLRAGAGRALADTNPINPQATAQVTVDFPAPGRYSLATQGVSASPVRAASLRIGAKRASSDSAMLQP